MIGLSMPLSFMLEVNCRSVAGAVADTDETYGAQAAAEKNTFTNTNNSANYANYANHAKYANYANYGLGDLGQETTVKHVFSHNSHNQHYQHCYLYQ